MAKLTTKSRKEIPTSQFALPGRRYPVEDRAHAGNAKARASQQEKKGLLSSAQKEVVDRAANRVLGKKKGK